ncbi:MULTISPECIES: nucleoside recognition domain-containing protein [Enterococcus]|uniref:nucleoside recognition domain-containing protein n=1 Tax=Enterococcus TaxID=1350 RepID=UPI0002E22926|nr:MULTISPECIES: nucleoside recognition domain-containing protein [Enterococcus]MDO0894489.1 nucleoside recognition domain-containing protein [Enterococcus sp. B1E4]MDO0907443.1 nucleoside recognition domain-containing protein [Enterococcus sp. B2E4]
MKTKIKSWLSLILLVVILSGAFSESDSFLRVFDFTNLSGQFGLIGDTNTNFLGTGGFGAREGFLVGLNLLPAIMLFCGLLDVFEHLGVYEASQKLFSPILKPLLGIPGSAGVAFISSFTGSDVAAVMTRDLVEKKEMTDGQRTAFVAYQYAGSAPINNTITGGAPLLLISPIALGPILLVQIICKIVGANLVRYLINKQDKRKVSMEKRGNQT